MNQDQPNPAPIAGTALNPLAFMHGTTPVFHVRKDSNSQSPITNYWFTLHADGSNAFNVQALPDWTEPVYPSSAPLGEYGATMLAEARRVIGLYIDQLNSF